MNGTDAFPVELRVGYKLDSKVVNSADFILVKEDHTLGNLLRMKLLENPSVRFAGYRHPHPLEPIIELKVRTDGTETSLALTLEATSALKEEAHEMTKEFRQACERFRNDSSFNNIDGMLGP